MTRFLLALACAAVFGLAAACETADEHDPWPPLEDKGTSSRTAYGFGGGVAPTDQGGFTNSSTGGPQTVDASSGGQADASP